MQSPEFLIIMCPGSSDGKDLPAIQETRVQSLGQKFPWRREWQFTPIFLPGEFNGQKSIVYKYRQNIGIENIDTENIYVSLSLSLYIYIYTHIYVCICCCLAPKLCSTVCDPMDCSPSSSSVHGISQARILEWVAISFSEVFSGPRDQTHASCNGRQILYC